MKSSDRKKTFQFKYRHNDQCSLGGIMSIQAAQFYFVNKKKSFPPYGHPQKEKLPKGKDRPQTWCICDQLRFQSGKLLEVKNFVHTPTREQTNTKHKL